MLAVLIARDSYHQNLWLQAIAELEEQEGKITSGSFDRKLESEDIAFSLYNHSASSKESAEGSWLGLKVKHLLEMASSNMRRKFA